MAYAMREQTAAAHQMMDQLGRQPEAGYGGNPHNPRNPHGRGANLDYLKFAEFRKMNPHSFRGAYDSDKVDELIKAMEKSFFCPGLLRPSKGDLYHLYVRSRRRVLVERRTETIQRISDGNHLDGIKRVFYQKYFLATV